MRNWRMIGDWRALDNKECDNRRLLDQKRTNDFVLSKNRGVVYDLYSVNGKFVFLKRTVFDFIYNFALHNPLVNGYSW